jgi:hypothetical protein
VQCAFGLHSKVNKASHIRQVPTNGHICPIRVDKVTVTCEVTVTCSLSPDESAKFSTPLRRC